MMIERTLMGLIAVCLTVVASCGGGDGGDGKDPMLGESHILSYASPYPPGHPFSKADQKWMDHIVTQSDGRLRFKTFWGGSLISSEMSMLEIRHGVADIGLITPIYTKGGAHLLQTQAGFFGGVKSIEDQVAVFYCLLNSSPQFNRELDGLKVLAVQGGNFPGVLTKDRIISSLDDFRGLRLRVQSEAVDVIKALGADPVTMPMGEVYSALAKGIIDGVVAPADTIHSLHFSEVANHFTTLRFSRGAYPARAMSEKRWLQLPVDLQALIVNAHSVWESALSDELKRAEERGIAFGAAEGITFHTIPATEQARFDQLYNALALDQAQELATLNIDAEPIFHLAQQLILTDTVDHCGSAGQ